MGNKMKSSNNETNNETSNETKSKGQTLWIPMPGIKRTKFIFISQREELGRLYLLPVDNNTFVLRDCGNLYTFNVMLNKWKSEKIQKIHTVSPTIKHEEEELKSMIIETIDEEHTFLLMHNAAHVLYDFEPQDDDDDILTIKEGEIIQILDYSPDLNGWALAVNEDGTEGYIPAEYVLMTSFFDQNVTYHPQNETNVIFVKNKSDPIYKTLDCPTKGHFIGISINYSSLLTFGYLRSLNLISKIPHDIILMMIDTFLIERIHLIECKTGFHWRANLVSILEHAY